MSTHTPGPWHVAPENKAQSPWIVCDPEGGSVADCEPRGPWMSNETADANARLIAASPELLDALKRTVECIEFSVKSHDPKWDGSASEYSDLGKARAAIAKADGHHIERKSA